MCTNQFRILSAVPVVLHTLLSLSGNESQDELADDKKGMVQFILSLGHDSDGQCRFVGSRRSDGIFVDGRCS